LETWKRTLETGMRYNVGVHLLDVWKSVLFTDQVLSDKNILF